MSPDAGKNRGYLQPRRIISLLVILLTLPEVYADGRDERCRKMIVPDWSATEAWVWEQICMGYGANLDTMDDKYFNPHHHDQSNEFQNRAISSSFLTTILFDERFQKLVTRHGVTITGAHFTDDIDLRNGRIPWPLTLSHSLFSGTVDMTYLQSDHQVVLRSSRYMNMLRLDSSVVGGNLSIDEVDGESIALDSASIAKNLSLKGSTFRYAILRDAHVGGRLDVSYFGSLLLNMVSTTIEGDIIITGIEVLRDDKSSDHESSEDESKKIQISHVNLDGMTYRRLRYTGDQGLTVFLTALNRSLQFSYQPYHQLASALKRDGAINLANNVVFTGKTRELNSSRGWTRFSLGFLKLSVGFGVGYYTFFAIFWVLILTLFGSGFLHFCGELKTGRVQRIAGYGIWFSIDYLLPIVQFNKGHFEDFNLLITNPVARVYFYCHRLLGYFLSVVLLTTITRVMSA